MKKADEVKARELYEQALAKPEEARAAFLDRMCPHGEIRRRVGGRVGCSFRGAPTASRTATGS